MEFEAVLIIIGIIAGIIGWLLYQSYAAFGLGMTVFFTSMYVVAGCLAHSLFTSRKKKYPDFWSDGGVLLCAVLWIITVPAFFTLYVLAWLHAAAARAFERID